MNVELKFVVGTADEEKQTVRALVDKLSVQADKYNSRALGKAMWISDAIQSRKIASIKSFSIN